MEEVELTDGRTAARKKFDPHPSFAHDDALVAKAKQRFIREVSVQAQLSHPHVVPILLYRLDDDPPWFVMPYATRSLVDEIDDCRGTGQVAIEPVVQMLSGLEELHRLGFVHRDLKPQNVLKVDGRWMLSDLGLVLPPSSSTTTLTGNNSAWGTQAYAAPEVITSFHTVTPAADIFSVGCILHDFVSEAPRIPYGQCTAHGSLGLVIEKCTASRPEQRFADVATLRSILVTRLSSGPGGAVAASPSGLESKLEFEPQALTADEWHEIARTVDVHFGSTEALALLYALDGPQLRQCHVVDPLSFLRLASVVSRWAREANFNFVFCDVLGARLAVLCELGGTRERAEAVFAALILGEGHNRWSVMRLFFRLASTTLDDDAAERVAIELLALGGRALYFIERCEQTVHVPRTQLHRRLQNALCQVEAGDGAT